MSDDRLNRELAVLHEIGKVLSLSTDINKALTSSLTLLHLFLGMRNGTVALFDPVTADLFLEAAPEMSDAERIRGRCRPREGITGRIFDTGAPMVIPDPNSEPLLLGGHGVSGDPDQGPAAFLGVPIRNGRVTLGVLTADRPLGVGPISFDRDLRLLTMVATLIAARVRLHQLENPRQGATMEEGVPVGGGALRFPDIVGRSAAMREVLDMVARVAPSRATVLLRGESGTGKELIARAIHDNSPRAGRPFVVLNCAAIPETLLESELFGHERGAFTGAAQTKPGHFELADGGTLFLDEIGETPPAAQTKLLRVLQERQFERLGGRRTIAVDVRVVAATNRDLEAAVRDGSFRFDLYYRLNVVSIFLPPLRDRREDVPALAEDFLRRLGSENGKQFAFSPEALEVLLGCRWWSGDATLNELGVTHRARVNLIHCYRSMNYICRTMEERYGIPWLEYNFFGPTKIKQSMRTIAALFDDHVRARTEEAIARYEPAFQAVIDRYRPRLEGKTVMLLVGGLRPRHTIGAWEDLGMEVVGTGYEFGHSDDYQRTYSELKDGVLLYDDPTAYELEEFAQRLRPDLMGAGVKEKYVYHKMAIPFRQLHSWDYSGPYHGVDGFAVFARDVDMAVNNPAWSLFRPPWVAEPAGRP